MNNLRKIVLVIGLILTTGSVNGNTQENHDINNSVRRKIFLDSRFNIPKKRALVSAPIEAYIEPNLLIISCNEQNYHGSVNIVIKDNANIILDYTVYIEEGTTLSLPVDLEENRIYTLEISSTDGDFMSGTIDYSFE